MLGVKSRTAKDGWCSGHDVYPGRVKSGFNLGAEYCKELGCDSWMHWAAGARPCVVKESRPKWHLDLLEKEKIDGEVLGWLWAMREKIKRFGPSPFSGLKPFLFSNYFFQITNYFDFKSNLNFE
jgi:hypothetical protein